MPGGSAVDINDGLFFIGGCPIQPTLDLLAIQADSTGELGGSARAVPADGGEGGCDVLLAPDGLEVVIGAEVVVVGQTSTLTLPGTSASEIRV